MLESLFGSRSAICRAVMNTQAVIEFSPDGDILSANDVFLKTMGYRLSEIRGKHHRMFLAPDYAASADYRTFWRELRDGKSQTREFKRIAKGGSEIWLQATYAPLRNAAGHTTRIVKIAQDITARQQKDADNESQVHAISRSQAVIQFSLDGTVLAANENFLKTMGYTLDEVVGKPHRMFVAPEYAASTQYERFWAKLRSGEFESGEFKRFAKGGCEVWLQATYDPIIDETGKVQKVVKFAIDITQAKLRAADYQGQVEAISRAQAVIQFDLDGKILTANENFLRVTGYVLSEIQGKHHRMFLMPGEADSAEYKHFWEKLRQGQFDARVFQRRGRNGKAIWIQASYNPIFDAEGNAIKVVKFASDITDMIDLTDSTRISVQKVADATEAMSTSIAEIGNSMTLSSEAAASISDTTATSGAASAKLVHSMQSMREVVELIRGIAGRVNILALNANIEAARAGEAGKAFAVVASEVKNLSDLARDATDKIADEISSVQEISDNVAESVRKTIEGVEVVNQHVSSVASAIELQKNVTRDISATSLETARAVDEITDRVKKNRSEGTA